MGETERSKRMIESAPDYYGNAALYRSIQEAIADELNQVDADNEDIRKQLRISTATWGLKYWEEKLGITVNEADSYEIRRSRVWAKWRSPGNFSADLVKSVCASFPNGEVDVAINIPAGEVTITLIGARGIPPNLYDLQAAVENIIHAHLGLTWAFTYLLYDELKASNHTYDQLKAHNLTYNQLKVWTPA